MTDDESADSDEYDVPEDHVHMEGCTCEHEPEDHGWGECKIKGCPCQGGWAL